MRRGYESFYVEIRKLLNSVINCNKSYSDKFLQGFRQSDK